MDECADYMILGEESAKLGIAHHLTLLGNMVAVILFKVIKWCCVVFYLTYMQLHVPSDTDHEYP